MQNKTTARFIKEIQESGIEKFVSKYFNFSRSFSEKDIDKLISSRTAFLSKKRKDYFDSMHTTKENMLIAEVELIKALIEPMLSFQDWDNIYSYDKVSNDFAVEAFEFIDVIFSYYFDNYKKIRASEKDIISKNFVFHCNGLLDTIDDYFKSTIFDFKASPFYKCCDSWLKEIQKIKPEEIPTYRVKPLYEITFHELFINQNLYSSVINGWLKKRYLERKNKDLIVKFSQEAFSKELKTLLKNKALRTDINITAEILISSIKKTFNYEIGIESYNHAKLQGS